MKQIVALVVLVLGMSTFVSAQDPAQDKSKGTKMTGTICDQKCVKQDAGKSSCDLSCTEESGNAVFLDDQGKAWNVTNPAVCKGHMGKNVTVQCKKMKAKGKGQDQDAIQILGIYG